MNNNEKMIVLVTIVRHLEMSHTVLADELNLINRNTNLDLDINLDRLTVIDALTDWLVRFEEELSEGESIAVNRILHLS